MSASQCFGIPQQPERLEDLDAKIAAHRKRRYGRTLADEQMRLKQKIKSHLMSGEAAPYDAAKLAERRMRVWVTATDAPRSSPHRPPP